MTNGIQFWRWALFALIMWGMATVEHSPPFIARSDGGPQVFTFRDIPIVANGKEEEYIEQVNLGKQDRYFARRQAIVVEAIWPPNAIQSDGLVQQFVSSQDMPQVQHKTGRRLDLLAVGPSIAGGADKISVFAYWRDKQSIYLLIGIHRGSTIGGHGVPLAPIVCAPVGELESGHYEVKVFWLTQQITPMMPNDLPLLQRFAFDVSK